MKCFGCGEEGHVIKACPKRGELAPPGPGGLRPAADGTGSGAAGSGDAEPEPGTSHADQPGPAVSESGPAEAADSAAGLQPDSREGQTGEGNGAEVSSEGGGGTGDVTVKRRGEAEAGEGSEATGAGEGSAEQVREISEVRGSNEDRERQESGEQCTGERVGVDKIQVGKEVEAGGDFNCTENELLDRNHAEPHPASQHALRQLVYSHGLVDVWRRMHTSSRQYTWSHISDNKISLARLDRFYCFKHQHTLNVTRDITGSIRDLETSIVDLEHMSESTGNRGCFEILKTKKMALANLLDTKVQGALVRSHVQNITEMDAPSSFFFGMEKKHGQRKYIHSLLSDTGQELTEPGEIRGRALDCPLSTQELHAALQSMQARKAPGIDGLTVEFYKAFWDILAGDLLEVFNESLASGLLPLSCRRAVITLLPKKGNLQDIKNWRPVSLLCMDYKILSKVLANRLKRSDGADHPSGPDVLRAWQLVDAAGPALTDAQAVSSVLGVRSVRLVERGLELWRQRLSEKERTILNRYGKGEVEPDHKDTFPEVHLSPDFKDLNGPLLTVEKNTLAQVYTNTPEAHKGTLCHTWDSQTTCLCP
ncbi:hypothetical protein L3Q82_008155 [Scortum barcoo]|uniref:Uncharacterized protein n=1 Tax=Scortum barcoo TaxID=214431 RepID=A0ACB8WH28_9TELE|nr:hypothetical protein L3Q82_008155 [Scortum barcoo]